jgi:hypothetical protein
MFIGLKFLVIWKKNYQMKNWTFPSFWVVLRNGMKTVNYGTKTQNWFNFKLSFKF